MPTRPSSTEAAVAATVSSSDARAAAGVRSASGAAGVGGGPGSSDPLVAGLRKAGLLRLLVLHFLRAGPSYGNQLMDRVGELSGGLISVNPNTMYPLLRALEADGLAAGEWEHPERRSRRFYRLTEAGATECDRLTSELGPKLDELAAALDLIRGELLG
ncbi:MAG: PadR family transcriptional regulator, regulatory protein PadR [Solirubrobacteraceae bacterium]|jgi:DNA-binding PadR family transcriptional regulator|nr:PadR family transcriptional regulator, regulatory protein PadR [Solirubrobacteraceae bacterium]